MNEIEALILKLIKEDPFISLIDLAAKADVPGDAVAGHIFSLTKKGKIMGRAYILPERRQVLCVGGANVDRKIWAKGELELGTSNPAESSKSCGGVARNIAENLGRLGNDVSVLTVVGDDHEGHWLVEYTRAFVDVAPSEVINGQSTGAYTAVLDHDGEMTIALAEMSIYDSITPEFIDRKWGYFASSDFIMLDTNFPADVLGRIIERCRRENIQLCITPVSSPKAKKLPRELRGVTWLIANREEAEAISGIKIENEGDFFRAAEIIIHKGVEKVVISRGDKGLIYFTAKGEAGVLIPPAISVIDVTGAGDSLVAGIIYAHLNGIPTEDACKIGMACSILTLQSIETVNPILNNKQLLETFKQNFK
ncbi:winged helix-turn-helix transcriptional regulator [Bacillus sp. ISL-35]|uniref:carbohydrate kinase n=1 Tax=Bacillus sp. ISL-35 TaxID=2819122 RepID=UPI001BE6F3B4|nr:carbohydrate kinase [Bacillus sp. ISL-35]MBT2679741.1 winged helix-turn-helix transcriptional regulator [Bacillus sp. ISL-35]MBT2704775.1 winged helix-turn-helix transcriptional regulator [Chryseobacterium sp. ISL-80]